MVKSKRACDKDTKNCDNETYWCSQKEDNYANLFRMRLALTQVVDVLWFNATLRTKVISWRLVTHMCFLAFLHKY